MKIAPKSLQPNYWQDLKFNDNDLNLIYNHLLEVETPLTPQELIKVFIDNRIKEEIQSFQNQKNITELVYQPKNNYEAGNPLIFPALDWKKGKVIHIREGNNPDYPPFKVIEVEFNKDEKRLFASLLPNHPLNDIPTYKLDDPLLDTNHVINTFGVLLANRLTTTLEKNKDLVRIAGKWFPSALLVDVNIGHLNLAEALLDMQNGGPLPTTKLLEQIELPTDTNYKLTEFSLNFALQDDKRFDEVGPSGEIIWYLHRLEPENVQNVPNYLKYSPQPYDKSGDEAIIESLEKLTFDELVPGEDSDVVLKGLVFTIIFPHWRAGTLPLAGPIQPYFPSAYESPRVLFSFVDGNSGKHFPGWVVRQDRYVFGLQEWYKENDIIPGSLIHIKHGEKPGEVIIAADRKRPTKEWIRTALIGADGGIVFALLKQTMSTTIDERMVIAVPDILSLDQIWQQGIRQKTSLEQTVHEMTRELSKLNQQGHVHAQEIYSAVNMIRRCPPGPIIAVLNQSSWVKYLGNLYYRLQESEDGSNE